MPPPDKNKARPPSQRKQADILFAHALAHHQRGDYKTAGDCYARVLDLDAQHASAWCNLGLCEEKCGNAMRALQCYAKALAIQPGFAGALYNRGTLLRQQRQWQAALRDMDQAIQLEPGFAPAHNNRGNILTDLGALQEAIASFSRAIQRQPGFAEAWNNRGVCHWKLGKLAEAISDYQQAISLKPAYYSAWQNLATALFDARDYSAARHAVTQALALQPQDGEALGLQLEIANRLCDWTQLGAQRAALAQAINSGARVKPFTVVTNLDDPALQQAAAQRWARDFLPAASRAPTGPRTPGQRLRIAYLSADFHEHATSYLMANVFEQHDRARFEIHALSTGPDRQDAMRLRLQAGIEHFVEASRWSDGELLHYLQEQQIDILVDLKGYTAGTRLNVLAAHAVPLQISYLGYPGTTGSSAIDYIVADDTVLPPELYVHFSEKVLSLPGCYQCNDSQRAIANPRPTRQSQQLPEQGLVLCCFNQHYKLGPEIFSVWMHLLAALPDSVLWLYVTDLQARANLTRTAQQHGIEPSRLVFADTLPMPEHLARLSLADLFLDTLPCNAHTTASDALWAGVPVLTCTGHSFCGRVASSLLHALGLAELVTPSLEIYEQRALQLGHDRQQLAALRAKLAQQCSHTTLFDGGAFTRAFEQGLMLTWQRYLDGLPPDHLRVAGPGQPPRVPADTIPP